jgi:mono/diheme cytochrome c family protein
VAARTTITGALLVAAVCAGAAGRPDLHDQPQYTALEPADVFADGSSARPPVPGTVPRGQLRDDAALYTGKIDDEPVAEFPVPVDERVLNRGHETFDAYCAPCHARTGEGDGLVVQRGYSRPPSLHDERLRAAPPGHFFDVITNGFGAMPDHAAQIRVEDRWAIVAYIRALQLSRAATIDDVPQAERSGLAPGR